MTEPSGSSPSPVFSLGSPIMNEQQLNESTLRRYNQVVFRLGALTWVITHIFDWFLLTMSLEELISSAVGL